MEALGCLLLGQGVSGPSTPDEALVWAQAATFLSGRIQGSPEEMPGRAPDMSPNAATMMRRALARIEAANKLMSNRERVVQDITNAGPGAVGGGQLTQLDLTRVDGKHKASVDAMVRELCGRLLGQKKYEPSTEEESKVWAQAAMYYHLRIQASAAECHGRTPDMSFGAAEAT